MSKEYKLFEQIVQATDSKKMLWKLKSNTSYSDVIFQPNHVFRIFEGEYEKDGDEYTVLLVEKKYGDPEWDFEVERYRPEIYFLYQGSIVLVLDDTKIELQQLIQLINVVEITTDRARKLLS